MQDLAGTELHALSMRQAMLLPESYTPSIPEYFQPYWMQEFQRALTMSRHRLMRLIESSEATFLQRFGWLQASCLREDMSPNPLNPQMMQIPGGEVTLGLEEDRVDSVYQSYAHLGVQRSWVEKEAPSYKTHLKTFRIGRFPVTNCEYRAFLEDSQAHSLAEHWPYGVFPLWQSLHPVCIKHVEDAYSYAEWLSSRTGRRFRLPSESEWEFAAAGWSRRSFPWGDSFDAGRCNTVELGVHSTTPVGMFPNGASEFGVEELAGNVEEFVSTTYAPYPGSSTVCDDLLEACGDSYQVTRGGSFTRFSDLARCKRRHGKYPSALYVAGFRLVEDIELD